MLQDRVWRCVAGPVRRAIILARMSQGGHLDTGDEKELTQDGMFPQPLTPTWTPQTLPQQLAWLDLVCTWVAPLAAAINAVTFTVLAPDHAFQGLPFQPWSLFWQTLAMACVVTFLHAASLRHLHQHLQRQCVLQTAAENGGGASTSASCGDVGFWPMKRPAAVPVTTKADSYSGSSDKEQQRPTEAQAAVRLCSQVATSRYSSEDSAPELTAAHRGSRECCDGRQPQRRGQAQEQQQHREQVQEQDLRSSVLPYTGVVDSEVLDPIAAWSLETRAEIPNTGCATPAALVSTSAWLVICDSLHACIWGLHYACLLSTGGRSRLSRAWRSATRMTPSGCQSHRRRRRPRCRQGWALCRQRCPTACGEVRWTRRCAWYVPRS